MYEDDDYRAQIIAHLLTCICAFVSIFHKVGIGIIITAVICLPLAIAALIAADHAEHVPFWHILCAVACIMLSIFWVRDAFFTNPSSAHRTMAISCLLVTAMETVFAGATIVELVTD